MLSTYLTPHFQLGEFVRSGTATRLGIDNMPGAEAIASLRALCVNVLEPLRQRYGRIIITSGYRCPRLNKAVGGAQQSQHMRGEAADIYIASSEKMQKYATFIADNTNFDQLIIEKRRGCRGAERRWLHVSYTSLRANRHEVLTCKK